MAVKLRMKRFGRNNRPEFRIVATDARAPRDGAIIENLGWYHPLETKADKVLLLNDDRVRHWLSVGAQPSETLVSIFKKRGIAIPWIERAKEKKKKAIEERRKAKGKTPKSKAERAAQPKKPKAPKPEGDAGPAGDKAKAAKSKAARRAAKKAK